MNLKNKFKINNLVLIRFYFPERIIIAKVIKNVYDQLYMVEHQFEYNDNKKIFLDFRRESFHESWLRNFNLDSFL